MADDKNISTYTAYDIEKYHKGLLSPSEMNKLERAALEDPFLADALDGYAETPVNLSADLTDLTERLHQKKEEQKVIPIAAKAGSKFIWWRVAAMIILIAGIGYTGYRYAFNNSKEELALKNTDFQKTPVITPAEKQPEITTEKTAITQSEEAAVKNIESKNIQTDDIATSTKPTPDRIAAAPVAEAVDMANRQDSVAALNEVAIVGYSTRSKKESAEVKSVPTQKSIAEVPVRNRQYEQENMLRNSQAKNGGPSANYRANIYRGQIVDAQQNPIPFANITNPVDNVGTYSDAKGRFSLISPDSVLQVQVRSLGYKEKNIALQTSTATSQVVLQDDQSISPIVLNQKRQNSNMPSRQNNLVFDEPEPEAGWVNYDSYLVNNIRLPDNDYLKNKKQTPEAIGQVQLSFEVSKQGRPINIKVEKSLCDACDKEAIRLLKEGPKWKRNKGKKHSTTIKVSF